jgi:hypothetical protein
MKKNKNKTISLPRPKKLTLRGEKIALFAVDQLSEIVSGLAEERGTTQCRFGCNSHVGED